MGPFRPLQEINFLGGKLEDCPRESSLIEASFQIPIEMGSSKLGSQGNEFLGAENYDDNLLLVIS